MRNNIKKLWRRFLMKHIINAMILVVIILSLSSCITTDQKDFMKHLVEDYLFLEYLDLFK